MTTKKNLGTLSLLTIVGFGFLAMKFFVVGFILILIGALSFGGLIAEKLKK